MISFIKLNLSTPVILEGVNIEASLIRDNSSICLAFSDLLKLSSSSIAFCSLWNAALAALPVEDPGLISMP